MSTTAIHDRPPRALQVTRFGEPGVLELVRCDAPAPARGEARVRVLASSATLSDSVVRRGMSPYLGHLAPPFTLGYDLVGRVEAVGPDAGDVRVGDLVADVVRFGANADLVVRPASALTRLPPGADPRTAEIMAMTGVTALQLLTRRARLAAGEAVLVHGASGSVGLVALAAARLLGASAVIGTASAGKLDLVEVQGASPVDRADGDLEAAVRRAAPGGVDVIVDAVGGDEVERLGGLLAPGGRLVTFGLSGFARGGALRSPEVVERVGRAFGAGLAAIERINQRGAEGTRIWAGDYDVTASREQSRAWYDADLAWLVEQVACGALAVPFEARPLEGAVSAHADIDAGRVRGRLVFDHRAPA